MTLAADSNPPSRRSFKNSRVAPANTSPRWPRFRSQWKEFFSEFWATFILVLFGDGAVAQVVLSGNGKGDWLNICLGRRLWFLVKLNMLIITGWG